MNELIWLQMNQIGLHPILADWYTARYLWGEEQIYWCDHKELGKHFKTSETVQRKKKKKVEKNREKIRKREVVAVLGLSN